MRDLVEQIEHITNRTELLSFINALAMDAKEHANEWVNPSISDYLEQIASYLEDTSSSDDDIFSEHTDYQTVAKLLYMGKIYE